MSSFWPKGIELKDTQSPREILTTAQDDWETGSEGVMTLALQDAKSRSGHSMIIVHAKHIPSNRTATLFSVIHRPNNPYPAMIQPEDEDLPEFLQKFEPQPKPLIETLASLQGQLPNLWVSDTPSEFRARLADVFNLGSIKSIILNLASTATEERNGSKEVSATDVSETVE